MPPEPYFTDDAITLYAGDCRQVLADLPASSVDAIVTDPPYELGFMAKDWDSAGVAFDPATWEACLRVLKPGGHLLAFGATRTYHRLTCAIEDAGFEIRDSLHWIYGSGFPKSLDVGKAIDKRRDDRADIVRVSSWLADRAEAAGISRAAVDQHMGTSDMGGWWLSRLPHRCQVPTWEQWQRLRTLIDCGDDMDAEVWRLNGRKGTPGEAWDQREVLAERTMTQGGGTALQIRMGDRREVAANITAPATPDARRWQGWGTALKPAHEPIVLARKPLAGTVAATVLAHGTGALNIDGCRVAHGADVDLTAVQRQQNRHDGDKNWRLRPGHEQAMYAPGGRWPTNVILTHPPALDAAGDVVGDACADGCVEGCPVAEMDAQSGTTTSSGRARNNNVSIGGAATYRGGGAFVGFGHEDSGGASRFFPVFRYEAKAPASERPRSADGTAHATVKPLALMRWLVRLATQPGGVVLDPFLGSGTTAEACVIEGFRCVGVELDATHLQLITARLSKPIQPTLGDIA
jgi:DNA modification methylase